MTLDGCRQLVSACLLLLAACGNGSSDAPVAVGTLERNRLDLIAEASEPIVEISVREGEPVEVEQTVLRLDDARLRAELRQAEAGRQRAAARLAELVRGPRQERIAEAEARLQGARGVLETERRELERVRDLVHQGVASPAELDRFRARYEEARARRDEAAAALEALLEGTTVEELDQARATLREAEAAADAIDIRVDRLTVRAPQRGRVDSLPYHLGERPPAGAVVAVLLSDQPPYARVYVPERIRAHVTPGTRAWVVVDGIERPFQGLVRTVEHEASFTPFFALTERDRGRLVYVAEVDLSTPDGADLPSGVPVEVTFELNDGAER